MSEQMRTFIDALDKARSQMWTEHYGEDPECTRKEIAQLIAYHLAAAVDLAIDISVPLDMWMEASEQAYSVQLQKARR